MTSEQEISPPRLSCPGPGPICLTSPACAARIFDLIGDKWVEVEEILVEDLAGGDGAQPRRTPTATTGEVSRTEPGHPVRGVVLYGLPLHGGITRVRLLVVSSDR